MRDGNHGKRVRMSSGVNALLGLWLIVCPWILGAPARNVAWSGVIAGILIVCLAVIRFTSRHTTALSWMNVLLGVWVIMAPWILGSTSGDMQTWTYVIAGTLVAVLEMFSLTSSAIRRPAMSDHTTRS
ncbi:MAG: SPW repeat protein [Terriglobia bacterium]